MDRCPNSLITPGTGLVVRALTYVRGNIIESPGTAAFVEALAAWESA